MNAFDLTEMAGLIDVDVAKIRNWTVNRPFRLKPSVREGGQGSINLYSLEDVYIMGIAVEFSRAGFAANAIGKLVDAARAHETGIGETDIWTVWRIKPAGPFGIEPAEGFVPPKASLIIRFNVGDVVKAINKRLQAKKKS